MSVSALFRSGAGLASLWDLAFVQTVKLVNIPCPWRLLIFSQ